MKKFILILGLLFALQAQTTLMAQLTDQDVVNFTAILSSVFDLTVTNGQNQTATFATAADYNVGVTELGGIVSGVSEVTMEATGNWNLQIQSPDFSDGGTQSIPIDNLGVWVEATGVHQFGVEVTSINVNSANCLGLSNVDQMLINLNLAGPGNGGAAADNTFNLHWEMGTMQGTMHATSMFAQMANGDFGPGTYTTVVLLTMTEIP